MAETNQGNSAQNPKKKGNKQEVFDGLALCTAGGLKKEDLMLNAKNKIVSKKRSEQGKKQIEHLKAKKNIELKPEPIKPEPQPTSQPLTFEPKSDSSTSNQQPKLEASREEVKKDEYPDGFPERYKDILKEEKSGAREIKESKPKKPRKINKKLENPVIDEILHGDKFENEEKI